jgi:hypothetical protein
LIILMIFDEEYKLRNSSLCSFLQPPVTSYLFGPNILNTLFSNTQRPSFTTIQNHRQNYKFVHSNFYSSIYEESVIV